MGFNEYDCPQYECRPCWRGCKCHKPHIQTQQTKLFSAIVQRFVWYTGTKEKSSACISFVFRIVWLDGCVKSFHFGMLSNDFRLKSFKSIHDEYEHSICFLLHAKLSRQLFHSWIFEVEETFSVLLGAVWKNPLKKCIKRNFFTKVSHFIREFTASTPILV